MKKIIFLLLAAVALTSCSTDSNSEDNNFFNLRQGNLWVYKRYVSNDNMSYTPTTRIDSVRITGDTLINSNHYAKFVHRIYNSNVLSETYKECLRVDSNSHLIDNNGYVYHAGTDIGYSHNRSVKVGPEETIVGWIGEELLEPFTTNIEGVDYFVYSYYGNFYPADPALPTNYIFYEYAKGIGMVNQRCAAISGSASTEDRLIYYDLN